MRISIILSTYNQPDWLQKTIWGYSVQSDRDFELVIADDGSTDVTRQLIDQLRSETGLAICHLWHEDRGFRKCTILNRAVVQCSGDYLIFSDGDCIPRRDFVATHRRHARSGYFLSGGYFKLPLALSQAITRDEILTHRASNIRWLRKHGLPWNRKLTKLAAPRWLATLCDIFTTTKATWNGHNASGWKADIVRVNGFDERMEWGAEDREMGERLMNLGIVGKRIRYRAVCVHLDHSRGYVRQEALARNKKIRAETARNHSIWTQFGIVKTPRPAISTAA
jgi:glycosyltransferase involved in cell wall biosynthesis